jgi:hypothetical protein
MAELLDLSRTGISPQRMADQASADERVLEELLNGISPVTKKMAIRENSFKALKLLSEQQPQTLLPHWNYLVSLLKSDNGFSKYAAIYLITALVPVDDRGRFEKAFNVYYDLLDDESVMVASHVAGTSGQIARAKPALQSKITQRLLAIDATHFDANRQGLIKSYIIAAFDEYFEESRDQSKILAFVHGQIDCASPKTRKKAKEFLKKWTAA